MKKHLLALHLIILLIFNGKTQCIMQGMSTYTNPCVNGFYSITVNLSFINPPLAGELVLTCCNGQSQTFYPPFQNSVSHFFTDIVADGASCTFTAAFSVIPSCSISMNAVSTPICPCEIPIPNVVISNCDNTTNRFSASGSLAFEYPPNSGTLTVSNCHGDDIVFAPPFVSPIEFAFDNLVADGSADCYITAVFSAQTACEIQVNFDAPPPCNCTSDVGTFSFSQNELVNNSNTYVVCHGDMLIIQSNLDFVSEAPNYSGLMYDPTLAILAYNCPPTLFTQNNLFSDPCFQEIWLPTNNSWTVPNINASGDQIYLVPVMLYNQVDIQNPNTSNLSPCFDLGELITVNLLPEIQMSQSTNCMSGTANIQVSGGSPAVFGSSFHANNLQPQTAYFSNNIAQNNEIFVINGLQDADVYSFDITDDNGCAIMVSGQFDGPPTAEITYANDLFCKSNEVILPEIQGTQGGIFASSSPGLTLNVNSGVINLSTSDAGDYEILYQVGAPDCFSVSSFHLVVAETYNEILQYTICDYDLPYVIGGFTFFESGIQGDHLFSVQGCDSIVSVQVVVEHLSEPEFISDVVEGCSPLEVSFQNLSEGNINNCHWYFGDNSPIVSGCNGTGHTYTEEGCYDVTLTTFSPSGCAKSYAMENLICVTASPTASFMINQDDLNATYPSTYFVNLSEYATAYVWNFGDNSNPSTEFSPQHEFPSVAGIYSITLTVFNDFCVDSISKVIEIENEPLYFVPNAFTPDGDLRNNEFKPILASGIDINSYNLLIFNRWGAVVFESNHPEIGWNGMYASQEAQEGMYLWKISFRSVENAKLIEHAGFVSLLR